MLQQWRDNYRDGAQIDFDVEMSKLARLSVGQTVMGADVQNEFQHALDTAGGKLGLLLGNFGLEKKNPRFRNAVRVLDERVYGILAEHRARQNADAQTSSEHQETADLLSTLIATRDKDTGEVMSDKQLRDELITLLLAGYDTTSRTLTWAFYALAQNPVVEKRLHEELSEVLAGRKPTYSDLPKLKYTSLLIQETMRLLPPKPNYRAPGHRRRRNRRLSHQSRFDYRAQPISDTSAGRALGRSRRVRAGALFARQRGGTAIVSLISRLAAARVNASEKAWR